mmetsp:Transcript_68284/g.108346  ORF Transcript_68284/g.108346 Transcript_68284/m.108346 type:complete len:145 (+) Transcript_68284:151-585(+)
MGSLCCGDNGYKPDDSSRPGNSPAETGYTFGEDVGHYPATAKPMDEPKLPTASHMLDSATEDITQAEKQLDGQLASMKDLGRGKSDDEVLQDEIVQQDADPALRNMGPLHLRNMTLQSKPNWMVEKPLSPEELAEMSKPSAMRA